MPDAIVLGAGIAGLAAAIALREAGYDVSVHDRAPALAPLGAALSLWPNAVEALRRLGAAERIEAEAAPIRTMLLATRTGAALIGPYRLDAPAFLPTRALLQAALLDALGPGVPVRLGDGVKAAAERDGGVAVRFAGGRERRAALLVVADGIWSPIATELLGTAPAHRGYGGVLAISDPVAGDGQDGVVAEYWGRGERFGLCDCGDGRRYWFYMRDAADGAPAPDLTDIARRTGGFPPAVATAVAATGPAQLVPFAIHARPAPRRLGRGRIVCVGDAAHAMEPNLGQGACQALEDAVALGAIARRVAPEEVLPRFEAARLARVSRLVKRSAEGRLGAHGSPVMRTLVTAALRATPNALHRRVIAGTHRLPPVG